MPESDVFFVKLTQSMGRAFGSLARGAKFTQEQQEQINFLGLPITAEQFYGTFYGLFILAIIVGSAVGALVYLFLPIDYYLKLAIAVFAVIGPIVGALFYGAYPGQAVKRERVLAIAYIPEIINYMVMSMRLNPNIERAVEFAASHGRGKIAEDFKKLVYDVQIGKYLSVEEGLDELAFRWGEYSDDFKHALLLIRGSLLETNEAKRVDLLEKASADVLEGSKEKMDFYARGLHQPTVYLYYFGILLPLLLAIVLPIGGSIVQLQITRPEYLFFIYCIAIPAFLYWFGSNILGSRPPTYVPPEIPENYPGLSPKGWFKIGGLRLPYIPLAIIVLLGVVLAGWFYDQSQLQALRSDPAVSFNETIGRIPHLKGVYSDSGFFIGQGTLFGILIGVSFAISIYLFGRFYERKKIQDDIRGMEKEFKDAMYVLASRLGENRPMEEALRHAIEFLPKSRIAKNIFQKILDNISMLSMTMDAAIFDDTYGALKNVPSQIIRGGMRVLVDSVELGVNVAAKSLIQLSLQIRNAQKVDEALRRLLEDVTTMLKTMAVFVAPIVLAVVAGMQRIIINSLSASCGSQAATQGAGVSGNVGFGTAGNVFCNKEVLAAAADPATFAFIMGIYVMEIVIILTYFNSQIEDANNKLHTWTSIAYSLPIAVLIYAIVSILVTSSLLA